MSIQHVEICNVIKFKSQNCTNRITMTLFKSQRIKMKNQNIKLLQNLITYIYISPRKTLALKVKCNYNIYMIRSLILSIAFFLLLRCKSKRGSTRRKMTLSVLKWEEGKGFFVYLAFVRGFTLGLLFSVWCLVGKYDVVFLMVMEEKQNKRSSLEVRLGLMGYRELRSY